MAITAPTPIMMPSMVRMERSLLRARARIAMRTIATKSIYASILKRGHILHNLCRNGPVLHQFIAPDCAVLEVDAALGEFRNVRLVSHQHDGQPVVIQLLKYLQDLDRCPAVQITR